MDRHLVQLVKAFVVSGYFQLFMSGDKALFRNAFLTLTQPIADQGIGYRAVKIKTSYLEPVRLAKINILFSLPPGGVGIINDKALLRGKTGK